MKKRIISTLLALTLACGLVAGCGASTEDTTTDASTSEETEAAVEETAVEEEVVEEAVVEEVTLQFLANETPLLTRDFWQVVADGYMEENKNVTIELIYQPSSNVDIREHAKTLLSTGQFPDVLVMTTPSDFVSAGALLALDETDVDMINPDYISKINDEIYVVPYKIQTGGVFYNKDMFAEYNVEVPETWDEFIVALDTFKDAGITPNIMGMKDGWEHIVPFAVIQTAELLVHDENWPSKRMAGEVSFADTPEFKTGLEKYSLLMNEYNVSDKSSRTFAQNSEAFFNGEAAMYTSGSWVQGSDVTIEHDFETGFFPIPSSDGTPLVPLWVNEGLSISAETEHPEVAKDFVRFFVENEEWAAKFLASEQLFTPLKTPVEYESTDLHKEVESYVSTSKGIPNFFDQVGDNAWLAGVSDLLMKETLAIGMNATDLDKAIENLDKEVDKIINN